MIDGLLPLGGGPYIPAAIPGVRPGYLAASLDEAATRSRTIQAYFADGPGIDAAGQRARIVTLVSPEG